MAELTNRLPRIAILVPTGTAPTSGGAFSAQETLAMQVAEAAEGAAENIRVNISHGRQANAGDPSDSLDIWHRRSWLERAASRVTQQQWFWRIERRAGNSRGVGLERKLRSMGCDLAVLCSPGLRDIDFTSTPFWLAHWDLGHRDLPDFPETSFFRNWELREASVLSASRKATSVIVESDESKYRLIAQYGVDSHRIQIVRPLPISFFQQAAVASAADRDTATALYPAQFWPHKNHMILLRALARLLETGRRPRRLIFTGSDKGNRSFVESEARRLGVIDLIDFRGFVDEHELDFLYARVGVTVMPSLLGPTNLPPLEALRRGCPVVATVASDAQLIWRHTIHLDGHDVEGWARALDSETRFKEVDEATVDAALILRHQENVEGLRKSLTLFANRRFTRG